MQELDKKDEQKDKQIEQLQQQLQYQQQQINELKKLVAGNNNISAIATTLPEQTAEDITLFPNPTTGMVTVKASDIGNGIIEIVDMQGNSLQKSAFSNAKLGYQLNVSGYAKGVYILNIIANNKKYSKRLVIQ